MTLDEERRTQQGDENSLLSAFLLASDRKCLMPGLSLHCLDWNQWVAVPKTGEFGTIMRVREIHLWASR